MIVEFMIASDHAALPGHFPGRPVVPGVVILDRVLAAIESAHGALGSLRLPQVKFMRPLLPEQAARIEVEACPEQGRGGGAVPDDDRRPQRWRFHVVCDDGLLASGEVAAA